MYEKQIQAGIEKLNEHFGGPEGWIYQLDLGLLDIAKCDVCVIGQLDAYATVGFQSQFGFSLLDSPSPMPNTLEGWVECYSILTEEWIDAIKELVNES